MIKKLYTVVLSLLALTISSCAKETAADPPQKERVLMVYLGGDNNLDVYASQKLLALRDGWDGNAATRIVAYVDTGDASLVEVTLDGQGNKALTTIADYRAENSASPEVFGRVAADVARLYPGASYGLLIFSHASGWLPEGTLTDPFKPMPDVVAPQYMGSGMAGERDGIKRSVVIDDSHDAEMSLTDLAAAIPEGMFDYIVFEACFMGGIEVAYQFRDKTPLILASAAEIVDPGFTYVYPSATDELLEGDLCGFAATVFNHITTTYSAGELNHSATFSVINTAGLDDLASFIKENCDTSTEVDIDEIQHFDRYPDYRLFFDFEDYYTRLLRDETKKEELSAIINTCVVYKAATPEFMTQRPGFLGFRIDKHCGLTTYIPQPGFPFLNSRYTDLAWYKAI